MPLKLQHRSEILIMPEIYTDYLFMYLFAISYELFQECYIFNSIYLQSLNPTFKNTFHEHSFELK